jgi:hypothetical protein
MQKTNFERRGVRLSRELADPYQLDYQKTWRAHGSLSSPVPLPPPYHVLPIQSLQGSRHQAQEYPEVNAGHCHAPAQDRRRAARPCKW